MSKSSQRWRWNQVSVLTLLGFTLSFASGVWFERWCHAPTVDPRVSQLRQSIPLLREQLTALNQEAKQLDNPPLGFVLRLPGSERRDRQGVRSQQLRVIQLKSMLESQCRELVWLETRQDRSNDLR
ncbi:MAG: hypothetical protein AAGI63_13135 [Planctomycetota bacterium]